MRPQFFVIAMSSVAASEPVLSARSIGGPAYPRLTGRPPTCQDETGMFDYSDEELSALVEWASLERTAV
jgi:hypothetical protein